MENGIWEKSRSRRSLFFLKIFFHFLKLYEILLISRPANGFFICQQVIDV